MSYDPGYENVTPRPGAPRFFKRVWDPDPHVLALGRVEGGLTIYGYACQSEYPEDRPVEKQAWDRSRSFLSWCFSVVEPNGEVGFTPLSEVIEITQEEFDAARESGWR